MDNKTGGKKEKARRRGLCGSVLHIGEGESFKMSTCQSALATSDPGWEDTWNLVRIRPTANKASMEAQ